MENVNVHLLLGTNLGDRAENLAKCRQGIGEVARIVATSKIYLTEAWGMKDQPDFYNQAIEVASDLSAIDLLQKLQDLEFEIGRVRNVRWESRIIDIDILYYGDHVCNSDDLKLPHPLLAKRNFALVPLLEIAPLKVDPVSGKTIEELYLGCEDTLDVLLVEHGV